LTEQFLSLHFGFQSLCFLINQDSLNKFLAVAEELAVKGLTTLDGNDSSIPPTYYDRDDDDEDVEHQPLPSKRTSTVKKAKRQNISASLSAASKRKGENDGVDSSMEVDIKRIKADPDEIVGRGGGGDDNGDLYEGGADGDDYEGLGQFDDDTADFDDSGAGGSGAGTSGVDNKGRQIESHPHR
jgi:hypothetical protein